MEWVASSRRNGGRATPRGECFRKTETGVAKHAIPALAGAVLASLMVLPAGAQETAYPVTIKNGPYTFTVEEPPQRAVSIGMQQTEMLLALGLADRMVGWVSFQQVVEENEELERIPSLGNSSPSLEVLLGVEADFALANNGAYAQIASREALAEYGIIPMVPSSDSAANTTIDTVYDDLRNLGVIFDVQPRAQEGIAQMQGEIAEVQTAVSQVAEPVRVFLHDGGTETVLTSGKALATNLIALAGGTNIFADADNNWVSVSLEEVVARDPEVIIILDPYGATTAEEKIAFLESNPAFSSVSAVQNGRYVIVALAPLEAGVRNADAVRHMAEGFYPELFQN